MEILRQSSFQAVRFCPPRLSDQEKRHSLAYDVEPLFLAYLRLDLHQQLRQEITLFWLLQLKNQDPYSSEKYYKKKETISKVCFVKFYEAGIGARIGSRI